MAPSQSRLPAASALLFVSLIFPACPDDHPHAPPPPSERSKTGGAGGMPKGSGGNGGASENGAGGSGGSPIDGPAPLDSGTPTDVDTGTYANAGLPKDTAPDRTDVDDSDTTDSNPTSAMSPIPLKGLGPWTGADNVTASRIPPGSLKPDQVPMFVSLGFDDNPTNEAVNWVLSVYATLKNPAGSGQPATYDGSPARTSFYNTSTFASAAQESWKAAFAAGHEIGNHTVNHFHGSEAGMNLSDTGWAAEISGCNDTLTRPPIAIPADQLFGFRTPFLEYNGAVFPAVKAAKFWYDCSIQEGTDQDQDGTNYFWPNTLDNGSPGHATDTRLIPITKWPAGLWEMPVYRVLVPGDADAQKYGVPSGLRAKLKQFSSSFSDANPKISGLDWNLWYKFMMNKAEFVATLKHSLDQHMKGNRSPFLFGMHSSIYTVEDLPNATITERRAAVVEFLKYAASLPDVRLVSTKAVLDWVRNPVPLRR